MLAALGLLTILALLALIMSGRLSPLVALIVVPTTAALVGGFGLDTAKFILTGLQQTASVAAMFVFAILYFGVMTDAGMLDPIVDRILRAVGMHPTRIVVGSALLALLVHLDGSGAVTFLVTIPAMLPLFERLGMDKRILACVVSMAAGVNFLPWTGPTLRASAALHISTTEIFPAADSGAGRRPGCSCSAWPTCSASARSGGSGCRRPTAPRRIAPRS